MLSRRAGLSATDQADAGRALATAVLPLTQGVGAVAAYVSVGSEPSTRELLTELVGTTLLLPVLQPDGDLDWAAWDGDLRPVARGLLEPAGRRLGPDAIAGCDLVIVPALAVDRRGGRLGRGGGSFDRALTRARGLIVALLHDGELVDRLPTEPHDVPVDAVVTPSDGVVDLRATRLRPRAGGAPG